MFRLNQVADQGMERPDGSRAKEVRRIGRKKDPSLTPSPVVGGLSGPSKARTLRGKVRGSPESVGAPEELGGHRRRGDAQSDNYRWVGRVL